MGFAGWKESVTPTDSVAYATNAGSTPWATTAGHLNGVLVGQSTGTAKKVWYRVFTLSKPTATYENFYITFMVQKTYAGATRAGILRIDIRMSSTGGLVEANSTTLRWIAGKDEMANYINDFALNYESSGQNIALFVKIYEGWVGWDFTVLSCGYRTGRNSLQMTLHNTGFTDGGESDTLPYANTIYSTI